MVRLSGKIAVITGGAGGIGQAAARQFTAEGARVVLVDRDETALQNVVQSIGEELASYAVADVTQPEQVQGYVNNRRHSLRDTGLPNRCLRGWGLST